uniref:Platelet-derived growth factor (PDGF) family profile domain-containing protein n=1 Tax=Eptatretus burgeri TaxID=7764 RepID=A0A8C4N892_EPTBU
MRCPHAALCALSAIRLLLAAATEVGSSMEGTPRPGEGTSHPGEGTPRPGSSHAGAAVPFQEVWRRSYCRTLEVLVRVSREVPNAARKVTFRPACVPLLRCAGCCNDQTYECVPTSFFNTTMQVSIFPQVMRIRPLHEHHLQEMTFVQHGMCECRQKEIVNKTPEKRPRRRKGQKRMRSKEKVQSEAIKSTCAPCTQRKRHLFRQDPHTCHCWCRLSEERCLLRSQILNSHTCRCERPRR